MYTASARSFGWRNSKKLETSKSLRVKPPLIFRMANTHGVSVSARTKER